ncbi:hypothetical protein ACT691_07460 [Vibrio metschnikovii]
MRPARLTDIERLEGMVAYWANMGENLPVHEVKLHVILVHLLWLNIMERSLDAPHFMSTIQDWRNSFSWG